MDLGCGRLRNLKILRHYFPDITFVDTKLQCERVLNQLPKTKGMRILSIGDFEVEIRKYDAIFLISVLHIIDDPLLRRKVLSLTKKKLKKSGFLVVDVPTGENYYRQHCTEKNRHGDGWVMGNNRVRTFYKNFSAEEIDNLVLSCTGLNLHSKGAYDKHIIRIWCNSTQ